MLRILIALLTLCIATRPARATELFRDDFNGNALDTSSWSLGTWTLGRTQLNNSTQVTDGMARLRFSTYNAANRGNTFSGTELFTKRSFARPAEGLEFEARVRSNALPDGLVTSMFTYSSHVSGGTTYSDEIDFEFLSKQVNAAGAAGDPVELTTYNDFNNTTLNYGDARQTASKVVNVPQMDVNNFNTLKIHWFSDRVAWYINGRLIHTAYSAVPDEITAIRFNIWAPPTTWQGAYSSSLMPTSNAALNQTYYYDLDYVAVRTLPEPASILMLGLSAVLPLQRRRCCNRG